MSRNERLVYLTSTKLTPFTAAAVEFIAANSLLDLRRVFFVVRGDEVTELVASTSMIGPGRQASRAQRTSLRSSDAGDGRPRPAAVSDQRCLPLPPTTRQRGRLVRWTGR